VFIVRGDRSGRGIVVSIAITDNISIMVVVAARLAVAIAVAVAAAANSCANRYGRSDCHRGIPFRIRLDVGIPVLVQESEARTVSTELRNLSKGRKLKDNVFHFFLVDAADRHKEI